MSSRPTVDFRYCQTPHPLSVYESSTPLTPDTPLGLNRMYVAQINDDWVRDAASAATRGWPKQASAELVTGGVYGAFWPVRERIARGAFRPLYDSPDGFVVPITLAWSDAFIEEICPDRDTPYANYEAWQVWGFLDGARENGRWAIDGLWR